VNKNFFYLNPQIKYRVKFRNYTKKGLLRIPSFVEYSHEKSLEISPGLFFLFKDRIIIIVGFMFFEF
jgi:hypothetical protein